MNVSSKTKFKMRSAFSLVEVVVAITVAAMVMIAGMGIYNSMNNAAVKVTGRIEDRTLPGEILQRIAEDIDRLATAGADTTITIKNKLDNGFQNAQLVILTKIYNRQKQPETFEKVVWQTGYDPEINRLTLYRSHSGMAMEDKMLEKKKTKFARELFIPLCTGITFFRIEVLNGEILQGAWENQNLPPAVVATISFAEPVRGAFGGLEVAEEEKIKRTIAVDRTRKIVFKIERKDEQQP